MKSFFSPTSHHFYTTTIMFGGTASKVACEIWLTQGDQAFENTSTSVAASQMRNALNNLADGVTDPKEKKVNILPYSF